MTHYPAHERQAFLNWIDEGFPNTATVEENYEPRDVTADELLRRFLLPSGCTDVMPGDSCQAVADHLDVSEDMRGLTYAIAASALLADRAQDGAGAAYLTALVGVPA